MNAVAVNELETKAGRGCGTLNLQFAQLLALRAQLLQHAGIDLRRRRLQIQRSGLLGLHLLQPQLCGLGFLLQFVKFAGQA